MNCAILTYYFCCLRSFRSSERSTLCFIALRVHMHGFFRHRWVGYLCIFNYCTMAFPIAVAFAMVMIRKVPLLFGYCRPFDCVVVPCVHNHAKHGYYEKGKRPQVKMHLVEGCFVAVVVVVVVVVVVAVIVVVVVVG